jgi:type IV fimbrial biogenesis protein FimT
MAATRCGSGGFTIIELLVVIAILAIMAALAGPSMTRLVGQQRLKSAATDLHLAMVKARSEAIKRNANVTVGPIGGSWENGWSIPDPENPAAPELSVRGATSSVAVTTTATEVVFAGTGRTTPATAGASFVFTSTGANASKCLAIDPSGRPYVKEGSSC